MANLFNAMQNVLFDLTTVIFGNDAVWLVSDANLTAQEARVNYRTPSEKDMIMSGMTYMPLSFFMEYREGVFVGLMESVRTGSTEQVTIDGVLHVVRSVNQAYDGKTFHAHLEKMA